MTGIKIVLFVIKKIFCSHSERETARLVFTPALAVVSSPVLKLSLVCSCKTVGLTPVLALHGAKNRYSVTTKLQQ